MTSAITLIGIDCAVEAKNVGIAIGTLRGKRAEITELHHPQTAAELLRVISDRIRGAKVALLAFDAPLGWPTRLSTELSSHNAGEAVGTGAHEMFRRVTDNVIHGELGKRSLDVGANLIARTAHAALQLLTVVRERTGRSIPLAWNAGAPSAVSAIEVYPAASVISRGWTTTGYKSRKKEEPGQPGALVARRALVQQIRGEVEMKSDLAKQMATTDHLIDAALCVLAAADFARGDVMPPATDQKQVALQEGWIWARPKQAT